MIDPVWLFQAFIAAVAAAAFAVCFGRAWHFDRTHPGDPLADHGIVMAAGLFIIAAANVATAYATGISPPWDDLRQWGGTMVRGALIVLAVYMVLIGPFKRVSK